MYKKQIETYEKIFILIVPLKHEAQSAIIAGRDSQHVMAQEMKRRVMETGKHDELLMECHKQYFILPKDVQEVHGAFLKVLTDITFHPDGRVSPEEYYFRTEGRLEQAFDLVIKRTRASLGIEALGKDLSHILQMSQNAR